MARNCDDSFTKPTRLLNALRWIFSSLPRIRSTTLCIPGAHVQCLDYRDAISSSASRSTRESDTHIIKVFAACLRSSRGAYASSIGKVLSREIGETSEPEVGERNRKLKCPEEKRAIRTFLPTGGEGRNKERSYAWTKKKKRQSKRNAQTHLLAVLLLLYNRKILAVLLSL